METDRWNRVEDLFHQAADLAPAERSALLDRMCREDDELRREVESLLAADLPEDELLQAAVRRAVDQLPTAAKESSERIGTHIGCYFITGWIGQGGMGVVYRAVREQDFRMQVALKLLQRGTDTATALRRFRSERQILAELQHPHIARLLDGGATESGLPYFVMEYVEGTPLLEYAAPLSVRQRVELFRSICSAVEYAHQKRIVHRDIKPANILVTRDGLPKLLDFGIAKLLDPTAEGTTGATLTTTGVRPMTPDYASPEQVRGEPITAATDIYSLGAVLYELLTGQPAQHVKTCSPSEIEKEICLHEPRKPSAVVRHLDPDLDHIVLKALRKEPEWRYASVQELAEDLDRFLHDLPVKACQDTVLYRIQKLLWRYRLPAATTAVFLLFLIGAIVTIVQLYLGAQHAQSSALQKAAEARARQLAAEASYLYTQPGALMSGLLLGLESVRRDPLLENRSFLASALALAGRPRAILGHQTALNAVAISPDGQWVATGSQDGTTRLWNARTVREWICVRHPESVNAVAISSDGRWLATASSDGTACLWNAQNGQKRLCVGQRDVVRAVAISPDGKWLVTAGDDKTARLWEAQTGRELARVRHPSIVNAVAVSPDGTWLATASNDKTARLWEAQTRRLRACLKHEDAVNAVAISSDGRWLATASSDGTACLWNAQNGQKRLCVGQRDVVRAVAISPDGKWLATAGRDHQAHLWDLQTGREQARLEHRDSVNAVAISPDGTWLVTASNDKSARLWEARTGRERVRVPSEGGINAVAVSSDEKYWAIASSNQTACLWDVQSRRERTCVRHEDAVWAVAISPDAKWIATASNDKTARIWDIQTGRERARFEHQDAVNAVALSPDGKWLATASNDGTACIWDSGTGWKRTCLRHQGPVRAVAISPDGKWLATASNDRTARIWDAQTGHERARLEHQDWVRSVAVSPDGKWLATASIDKTARIWEARTGQELARLTLPVSIRAVAISPDGKWLATGSHDNTLRLWDVQTKQESVRLSFHNTPEAVTFTRDNELLVAHGASVTIEPWRTADLVQDLCARLDRNLTRNEWTQYLGNEPYQQTCPSLPATL